MSGEFVSSDAWLFLAVAYASSKGPVSLSEVIGVADGIDKSIPTFVEVDGGLRRLLGAGWVQFTQQSWSLTPSGQQLLESAGRGAKDVYTHWKQIEGLWADRQLRPGVSPEAWHLSPDEYDAAVQGWRDRADHWMQLERKLDPYRPMWTTDKDQWYLVRGRGGSLIPIRRGDPPHALLIDEDDELATEVANRMQAAGVMVRSA